MDTLKHKLTKSEIKYGILSFSKSLGSQFIKDLPERFDVVINDITLFDRKIQPDKNRIWIGYTPMNDFKPGQIVTITKNQNTLIIG